jgi:hypothetical protein
VLVLLVSNINFVRSGQKADFPTNRRRDCPTISNTLTRPGRTRRSGACYWPSPRPALLRLLCLPAEYTTTLVRLGATRNGHVSFNMVNTGGRRLRLRNCGNTTGRSWRSLNQVARVPQLTLMNRLNPDRVEKARRQYWGVGLVWIVGRVCYPRRTRLLVPDQPVGS